MEQYITTAMFYQDIVQTAIDGFWIVRAYDTHFIAVNDVYCTMTGYSRDELLAMCISDVEAIEHPDETIARMNQVRIQGSARFETQHRRKDGTIFDVEVSVRLVQRDELLMVVFIRDISMQLQAKSEQARLTLELARKNRELEQIVYVASHDLRSPLVNVQGFSYELQTALADLSHILATINIPEEERSQISFLMDQDIPQSLSYILNGVKRMDALLKGLLRLSRLGRAALNIEPLDVQRIVGETLATFDFQIKTLGVHCSLGLLPNCRSDAVQVGQVFANLINNAIKYLDPHRPGIISISGEYADGMVIYCVADNGIGIAPEHQEKIFELYYRLSPDQSDGEGLGLTIVHMIVERLGGWIRINSLLGIGSQFFVALPAS